MGNRITAGRRILGLLIAFFLGLLLPFIGVLQISLMQPLILIGSLFIVFLQAWSGWIPAVTLAAMELVSADFFLGLPFALMVLIVNLLPAGLIIHHSRKNMPFFSQMRNALIYYGASLLAAVGIAYMLYGSDMISKAMLILQSEMEIMPDELFEPITESLNMMLSAAGKSYTVQTFREELLPAVFAYIEQAYVTLLPGLLFAGGLISAVLSVTWGNWLRARKGLATSESFVSLRSWWIPPVTTAGLLGIMLVTYLLAMSGSDSGNIASVTVKQIAIQAFALQALAAVDRRMIKRGFRNGSRTAIVWILAFVSLLFPLYIIGIASALFGSHGAVSRFFRKVEDSHKDE